MMSELEQIKNKHFPKICHLIFNFSPTYLSLIQTINVDTNSHNVKNRWSKSILLVMAYIGIAYTDKKKATLGYALFQCIHSFSSMIGIRKQFFHMKMNIKQKFFLILNQLQFLVGSFIPMPYQILLMSFLLVIGTWGRFLNKKIQPNKIDAILSEREIINLKFWKTLLRIFDLVEPSSKVEPRLSRYKSISEDWQSMKLTPTLSGIFSTLSIWASILVFLYYRSHNIIWKFKNCRK